MPPFAAAEQGFEIAVIKARNKLFDDLANSDDEAAWNLNVHENGAHASGPARSNHSDM